MLTDKGFVMVRVSAPKKEYGATRILARPKQNESLTAHKKD